VIQGSQASVPDHAVVLATDRLLLRAFQPEDAEELYAAVVESKTELGQWLSWCHADYSIHDTIEFLRLRGEAFREGEHSFALFEQSGQRLIGAAGINQLDPVTLRANLGYWLRTTATGHGYATEATRLIARFAFETLNLERIEIVAATGNLASQRVATAAGATREGIARARLRVHGVQHDAVVYSLIRSDLLDNKL